MWVNKAYKFCIYPNKDQAILINKTIGCSRCVCNFFLGKQKEINLKKEAIRLLTVGTTGIA
ncbi:helix-turn-helix domain-containing protein [Peribacillus loiseleuriae]|uniref:helix-turn-helix domain-containing protein n=1 Tax=Peribacillus loiseleuriae TaxID=1679170 RepID=UPI003D0358C4